VGQCTSIVLAGRAALNPTLVYGGADTFDHQEVKVLGWQGCCELLSA